MKVNYSTFKQNWLAWRQALQADEPSMAILWGPNDYLRAKALSTTKKLWRLRHPNQSAQIWQCKQLTARHFSQIFYQSSLMGCRQLHIIQDCTTADQGKLKKHVAGIDDFQHHLLWCAATKTAHAPRSLLKHLPAQALQIVAPMLRPYELLNFTRDLCGSLQLKLTSGALTEIVTYSGEQLHSIEQMLKTLQLLGPYQRWDQKDISACMDMMPEQVVFKVTDYLLKGDKVRAHLILKDLLDQNVPAPLIIGALHYHLKQLTKLLGEQHKGQKTTQPSYIIKRYKQVLARTTPRGIAYSLALLAHIDLQLKTQRNSAYATEVLFSSLLESL